MTLTLEPILCSAGIDPPGTRLIRHAYVTSDEDTGEVGGHSTGSCVCPRTVRGPGFGQSWRSVASYRRG